MARRIAGPLTELCTRAGCAVPRVCVMSRTSRSAAVRGARDGAAQLVVSRQLLERLDDVELRCVLAHEVSHLAAGDIERGRRRLTALFVVTTVAVFTVVVVTHGGDVAFPVLVSWVLVALLVALVLMSLLQRPREVLADAGAVALTGDPEHVVSALDAVVALSMERSRQVLAFPWRWLLFPFAWRFPSHPTLQRRTARILALAPATAPGQGPVKRGAGTTTPRDALAPPHDGVTEPT